MTKLEITMLTRAADELLAVTENPLHRQILENYRRHAILEVTGNWQQIFTPEMTVEHPVYRVNGGGMSMTLDGLDQVQAFYQGLSATETTVMVLEDENIAVADWGFASEAIFHTYVTGAAAAASFARGEGGFDADPERFYVNRRRLAMIWPYDERGRMIGEHVYVHDDDSATVEVPQSDFITFDEACEQLLPTLRDLPSFEPAS
jgi:hypothetical protein